MAGGGWGIEAYLIEFNEALAAEAGRRRRILDEVEGHLRDTADALVSTGMARGPAEDQAITRFGPPGEAARRFGPDPVGAAQRFAQNFDRWQVGHPWLGTTLAFSPWAVLYGSVPMLRTVALPWLAPLFVLGLVRTALVRNRAEPTHSARMGAWHRAHRRANLVMGTGALAAGAVLTLAFGRLHLPHAKGLLLTAFYVASVVAARVARPQNCTCGRCRLRWAGCHPAVAARVLTMAWALGAALPVVLLLVGGDRGGWARGALFWFLMLVVSFAPLPWAPARRWASQHPALGRAVQMAPLVALAAAFTVWKPKGWPMLAFFAGWLVWATARAGWFANRGRNDGIRRSLRAGDLPQGGLPQGGLAEPA